MSKNKSVGVRIRHRACDCGQQHRSGCLAPLESKSCRCPREHNKRCDHREREGRYRCGCPWSFTAESWAGGVRRQVTGSGLPSKRAAEDARREALGKLERREVVQDRRRTVGVAIGVWLAERIDAGELRPTTARSYAQHVRAYIVPLLGAQRLADVTRADLSAFERDLTRKHKQLSAASRQRVGATLRVFLRDAVDRGWLGVDPTTTRRGERRRKTTSAPPVRVWQPAQLGAFLDWLEARGERLAPVISFAVASGLRRGEVCGLRWADVDMRAGQVVVSQQAVLNGTQLIVGKPKTRSGEARRVNLDAATVAVLRRLADTQSAERERAGDAWQDFGLVFTEPDGRGLNPERLTKGFPKIVRAYNLEQARLMTESGSISADDWRPLPVLRWHDLRHTHASLMAASGADIGAISARLGHSSIAITQATYRHLIDSADTADAERAASLIPRVSTYEP